MRINKYLDGPASGQYERSRCRRHLRVNALLSALLSANSTRIGCARGSLTPINGGGEIGSPLGEGGGGGRDCLSSRHFGFGSVC